MIHFLNNTCGVFHIYVFVKAGAIYETNDQHGISHMLEHMLFKRSKNMTNEDILKESTKIGGGFNAATDKDVTYYYFKTTSEQSEKAIKIFAEILTSPEFTASDLNNERNVVLEEMNKGLDNDDRIIWHLSTLSMLGMDHPYSKKVIGTEKTLLGLTVKNLYDYFHEHYNKYTIVVNCEKKIQPRIRDLISRRFKNHLQAKSEDVECDGVPKEIQRKVIVFNKPLNQTNIILSFPLFKTALDLRTVMILEFISFVLSGAGLYSLLTYQLREKRGLIYNVSTYNENLKHLSTFRISLSTTSKDIKLILNIIFKILKHLKEGQMQQLQFFKESFRTAFKLNMTSEDYRTLVVGTQLFNTNEAELGSFEECINKINMDDISRVSKMMFDATNVGVVCLGDLPQAQALSDDLLKHIEDKFM